MSNFDKNWWEEFRRQEIDGILLLTGQKNSDYTGGETCENPFANFDASTEFGVDPLVGVCIRMQDNSRGLRLSVQMANSPLTLTGIKPKTFFGISLVTP